MFSSVPIEKVRSYWDQRPCNIRHSSKEVGSREYFDEVEARKYFVEPHIPRFAEFERWKGQRVLEIGCGIGTDTIRFARAGAQVTAIDLSEKSLQVARRRAEVFGFRDQIEFFLADAEKISDTVHPAPYDLVYSFGCLHHTPNPHRAIEEIRAHYVRPGTVIKLMLYNRYSWKVFWILVTYGRGAFWKVDQLVSTYSEAQVGCPVTYTFSRRSAERLLGDGFQVEDVWVDHIFPYRIPDYVKYRYVRIWYFRLLPDKLFRWLERKMGWHLCITARAK
jgi:SAM-dependent methyltransferase